MARLGRRPGEALQSRLRPPQYPLACGAGSEQSQAKGQTLGGPALLLNYLQNGMNVCLSEEPLGKAFIAQAKGGQTPSPQRQAPQFP